MNEEENVGTTHDGVGQSDERLARIAQRMAEGRWLGSTDVGAFAAAWGVDVEAVRGLAAAAATRISAFAAPMFESADGLYPSGLRVVSTTSPGFTFAPPIPKSFRFVDENGAREVLVLHRDGRVEIGAHLTPDAAGQKVFEVLRALWAQHMGAPPPSTSEEKAVPPKTWTLKQIFGAWQSAMEARHPMAVLDTTELTEDWRAFQERLTRAEDPKR